VTPPERPALPKLAKGDALVMRSGTPGRRDGTRPLAVRVVTVGRKYVHVIGADRFDAYDPDRDRWYVRKFLIEDQREGERGTRVGYSASIATAEQHEYDRLHGDADEYLREQGIVLRAASRWYGHEVLLADLMRQNEPAPAAETDV
jgi:hypothetical protein